MENKLKSAQFGAWILSGVIPAIFSIIGGSGWTTALLLALVCGGISFVVLRIGKIEMSRVICILELLWLTVLLGRLAAESATCWNNAFPAVPIILLAVSALEAQNGGIRAGRGGALLIWLILPVLAVVLLAGTLDADLSWVRKEITAPDGLLITLLLMPCLGFIVPREQGEKQYAIPLIIGLAVVVTAIMIEAVLGVEVASGSSNAIYEYSKSVTILGVAERFEALVACVLTAGWFSLFGIILSGIYHLADNIFPQSGKWAVWICAAVAAGLMCILPKGTLWMGIGCLIFWGFLPAITQLLGGVKNMQKK